MNFCFCIFFVPSRKCCKRVDTCTFFRSWNSRVKANKKLCFSSEPISIHNSKNLKAFSRVLGRYCWTVDDGGGPAAVPGLLAMPGRWYSAGCWSCCWCCWATCCCFCIGSRVGCISHSICRTDSRTRASASSSTGRAAGSRAGWGSPSARPACMERMNMDCRRDGSSHSRRSARDPWNSGRTEPSHNTCTSRSQRLSPPSRSSCYRRATLKAAAAVVDTRCIDIDCIVDTSPSSVVH